MPPQKTPTHCLVTTCRCASYHRTGLPALLACSNDLDDLNQPVLLYETPHTTISRGGKTGHDEVRIGPARRRTGMLRAKGLGNHMVKELRLGSDTPSYSLLLFAQIRLETEWKRKKIINYLRNILSYHIRRWGHTWIGKVWGGQRERRPKKEGAERGEYLMSIGGAASGGKKNETPVCCPNQRCILPCVGAIGHLRVCHHSNYVATAFVLNFRPRILKELHL